jgi:hypothetical protein
VLVPAWKPRDPAELRRLRRENAELERANAILKARPSSQPRSTGLATDRGVSGTAMVQSVAFAAEVIRIE